MACFAFSNIRRRLRFNCDWSLLMLSIWVSVVWSSNEWVRKSLLSVVSVEPLLQTSRT